MYLFLVYIYTHTFFQIKSCLFFITTKLTDTFFFLILQKSDYPSVAFSCPENKIPMWFIYQSESSSINVKLSSVRQNPNFLGFALCAVVVEDISCLELSCEANFKTKYGTS